MTTLTDHARRELEILGEDPWTIDGLLSVVTAFAACGHSGSSAEHTIPLLEQLLRRKALTPLTSAPEEWQDASKTTPTPPGTMWQNVRDSDALSTDGGLTFYRVSELGGDGEAPVYVSLSPADVRMVMSPDVDLDQGTPR